MLDYRSYDIKYILIVYCHFKLSQYFDIYLNDQLIKVVSEEDSLENYSSGKVEFVFVENKIRKRKLPKNSGYWKQNGTETNVQGTNLPDGIVGTKRTLTLTNNQDDKRFKLWEYCLLTHNNQMGYCVLIRHYLRDQDTTKVQTQRYISGNVKVSIRPNENNLYFNKCNFVIDEKDFEVIDSIHNFLKVNNFSFDEVYFYDNSYQNETNNNNNNNNNTTNNNNIIINNSNIKNKNNKNNNNNNNNININNNNNTINNNNNNNNNININNNNNNNSNNNTNNNNNNNNNSNINQLICIYNE
ncbi:hypothetical protein RB653_001287 [Dictyostelium firmibasis]|uniref:Uncharacterized protein n=1 Tax=Dictyostelium firmibasis TaxID=79012 RepID=A0AAN7YWI3_9MYCE